MYPTNKESGTVGKVTIDQKSGHSLQPSQAQVATQQAQMYLQQMQQMQAQMAQMQAQLEAQRQPKMKTYTFGQVQILLACETINHVLEEFEVSTQKRSRLNLARDYLLSLGDLTEFIAVPEQTMEQTPETEPGYDAQTGESLFEEDNQQGNAEPVKPFVEPYQGKADKTVEEEIDKINKKMAELKKVETSQEKAKGMSGIEKIKSFISRTKSASAEEPSKKDFDKYEGIPEGMG
jgi:hypothetical protein